MPRSARGNRNIEEGRGRLREREDRWTALHPVERNDGDIVLGQLPVQVSPPVAKECREEQFFSGEAPIIEKGLAESLGSVLRLVRIFRFGETVGEEQETISFAKDESLGAKALR